jgi:hypothetical protein
MAIRSGKYVYPSEDFFPLPQHNKGALAQSLATGILHISDGTDWNPIVSFNPAGYLVSNDGAVYALTETAEHGTSLTATGTGYTGAGYFAGINVTAYSGGPQTIVVRESTDNSGPILATFTVSAIGVYPFSPVGHLRVRFATGLHLTISGGTSRTVRALVEPA